MGGVVLSWPVVLMIFLCGVGLGWLLSKVRAGIAINIPPFSGNRVLGNMPGGVKVSQSVVRRLSLQCQCGAIWQFAEGSGPVPTGMLPPGTQPMPTGDLFVCPTCGCSIDLKTERQLEADALAKMNLSQKI